MNSEHVKLDSDENTTNLNSKDGDSYKFIFEPMTVRKVQAS